MNEYSKLMLAEKQVKARNAWNDFVDLTINEVNKHYSFCYQSLVREVLSHYYI